MYVAHISVRACMSKVSHRQDVRGVLFLKQGFMCALTLVAGDDDPDLLIPLPLPWRAGLQALATTPGFCGAGIESRALYVAGKLSDTESQL